MVVAAALDHGRTGILPPVLGLGPVWPSLSASASALCESSGSVSHSCHLQINDAPAIEFTSSVAFVGPPAPVCAPCAAMDTRNPENLLPVFSPMILTPASKGGISACNWGHEWSFQLGD